MTQQIDVSGTANNDGTYQILSVTALGIVLTSSANLTDETAPNSSIMALAPGGAPPSLQIYAYSQNSSINAAFFPSHRLVQRNACNRGASSRRSRRERCAPDPNR